MQQVEYKGGIVLVIRRDILLNIHGDEYSHFAGQPIPPSCIWEKRAADIACNLVGVK